ATNDEGTSEEATINFVIAKAAQTMTPELEDITKNENEAPFTLPSNTDQGIEINYLSSDVNVATISGNTVTITGIGTTIISATNIGNDNYEAFSDSFTLTVATQQGGGGYSGNGTFVLINSIEDLTDGYYVIAANPEFGDWAMSSTMSDNNAFLTRTAISPVDET